MAINDYNLIRTLPLVVCDKTKYSRKMEERQLIKLEAWFKPQRISCLKIVAKRLKKLPAWTVLKEQLD